MKARALLPIRRGLSVAESALYLGVCANTFRDMVKDGRMPKPHRIGARRLWDVDELDAAFKSLPVEGEEETDSWRDVGQPSP